MSKPIGLLRNEVRRQEHHLEDMERGSEAILERYDKRIASALANGQDSEVQKIGAERRQRKELFAEYVANAKKSLENAKEELAALEQAEYEKQRRIAAQAEASAKRIAKQQWIAKGGDPDVFEGSWPITWRIQQDEKLADMLKKAEQQRAGPPAATL